MRTANPALNKNTFSNFNAIRNQYDHMTIDGTVNKSYILLALLIIPAFYTWNLFLQGINIIAYVWGGSIGALIFGIITIFKKEWSPYTAPMYAVLEGIALGGISSMVELAFPGIVIQAVALTFGVLFCLLMAYKSNLIQVTENFKLGVVAATGGIFVIYFAGFIMSFFGKGIPYIHESGVIGVGFSLFIVVIAALNFVLDFDFIENAAKNNVPKYMEWYGAFGLMVTLVWLYLEILRLLTKLRSRN